MFTNITTQMKRHPLIAYFVAAYLITWILVSPMVASALNLIPISPPAAWHALGALGPLLAALLITRVVGGKQGLQQLLRAMGRWNVGIVWTLVAVLSPFALFFLSALALLPFGQPWPDFGQIAAKFADSTWLVAWFLGSAVYGLGEEPGWRGFALPRLQKTYSVLVSALILAAFWGLWHAPFFLYRFQLGIGQVIGLFMGLFAGSIWLAFLYNMTRGSVLATMSWHVTWNMVNSIAMLVSTVLLSLLSAEIMIAAVVIALVWKSGRISPRKAPTDTQQNHEPVHHPLPALAR